jgi:hypothetical protein
MLNLLKNAKLFLASLFLASLFLASGNKINNKNFSL